MKKTINKEVTICDQCGKETYVHKCLKCGVDHCWECQKTQGIVYTHSTCCSGSGDGYYCNKCDAELRVAKNDKLHAAYVNIQNLRMESELFYKNWKERANNAEATIKRLNKN